MGVDIASRQNNLEEQHAGRPDGRTAAEPWQNRLADERLYLKQQERTQEHGQEKEGLDEKASGRWHLRISR